MAVWTLHKIWERPGSQTDEYHMAAGLPDSSEVFEEDE